MTDEIEADRQLLRETTGRFLDDTIPLTLLRASFDDPTPDLTDHWRQGAELGWTSMLVGEEFGGGSISDEPLVDLVAVAIECGRRLAPGPLRPVNQVALAIARDGTDEQRRRLLPALADGSTTAAWCANDPFEAAASMGSTLAGTTHGDVLIGRHGMVEHADAAGLVLVVAATDAGLAHVLLDRHAEGLAIETLRGLDAARRFASVELDRVEVPADGVVGSSGPAVADTVERLHALGVVLQAAESVGATAAALELTVEYVGERVAFGRAIGSFQALKHRLADIKVALEASFGAVHGAARALSPELSTLGPLDGDVAELVHAVKSYVGDASVAAVQDCVQMHGGIGVTWEHDLHLFLRRLVENQVICGTPEQHRRAISRRRLAEVAQ